MVLADGVAYATQVIKPTHMMDLATLTGAQMMCTGMKHAAIMSNCEEFESLVRQAGFTSGDWVYPILYCPELVTSALSIVVHQRLTSSKKLKKEFESQVADLKNSVKDRMNASSSAAGHFIEEHFDPEWKGKWCHVDIGTFLLAKSLCFPLLTIWIAGPSAKNDRGTGFGVALVVDVAKRLLKA